MSKQEIYMKLDEIESFLLERRAKNSEHRFKIDMTIRQFTDLRLEFERVKEMIYEL